MSSYVLMNLNPRKRLIDDCVVRAFALATGFSWEKVLQDLTEIALIHKAMPNSDIVWTEYATRLSFKKGKVSKINGKTPSVLEFAQHNEDGTYLVKVSHHLVTVSNGKYYDTWNCGSRKVQGYWIVPDEAAE